MFDRFRKAQGTPLQSGSRIRYFLRFLLLLGFLFILGLGFHFSNHASGRKQAEILAQATSDGIREDYRGVHRQLSTLSRYIYEDLVSTPSVPSLMARIEAAETPGDVQTARETLYTEVHELYKRARSFGIKQLHFHSKESVSVLRMHSPERFGDSLVGLRRTVEIANRDQVQVSSFEFGRIYHGYRHVYPIFYEGLHVGSVEVSVGSQAVLRQFSDPHGEGRYAFLLNRRLIEAAVFEEKRSNYASSVFGADVLEESNEFATPFIHREAASWASPDGQSALKEAYRATLKEPEQPATVFFEYSGSSYMLTHLPIFDAEGIQAAALISVEPAKTLDVVQAQTARNQFLGLIVGAIMLPLASLLFYYWQRESKKSRLFADQISRIAENLPGVVYQFRYWPDSGRSCFPYASAGFEALFGVRPEAVREDASPVLDLLHPDDKPVVMASISESIRTMEQWSTEFRIVFEDGSIEWMEGRARPKALEDGSGVWYGFTQNITARKEYERLLEQAREDAERAERAKTRFLSTMSHEIRTPMNAIIGLSDLLSGTDLNEEQNEFVHTIVDSGNALLNLISDILDYSKIEAERLVIQTEAFDQVALFDKLTRIGSTLATGRGVRLVAKREGEMPSRCIGDEGRITQVLLNLLSNAVKFSEEGGLVEFSLRSSEVGPDRATFEFSVTDNGVGISEEQQARIFKPFAQVEDGTRPDQEGTGLGLAISARLSDLMGGELKCSSQPGKGARFSFALRLPIAAGLDNEANEIKEEELLKQEKEAKEAKNGSDGSGLNVLLVDDDPVNTRVAGLMLKKLGLKADTAENGQVALSACLAKDYDLVLMDLQMPVMDGIKATAAIFAQLPKERHPSVVALTANASNEQRKACLDLGMGAFLTKPLKMDRLKSAIDAVIEKK
jgi:PAS domain S-box-containing protein